MPRGQTIPPSERIAREIMKLLKQGHPAEEGKDLISELVSKGIQRVVQSALEQEQADFLGRGHYERGSERRGWRNGYEPGHLKTAEGRIALDLPQVRGSEQGFESALLPHLRENTAGLERLAVEGYARGLSTRDLEDAFRDEAGRPLLSRTAVSEMTEALWKEYEAFRNRDLSEISLVYLFLDGVYEGMRQDSGRKECILVACGITEEGYRLLLSLSLGNKESYECWLEFLRDLKKRGLKDPVLGTTDGAPGLLRAFEEVFPETLRHRCLVHRSRNIVDKLPQEAVSEVKAHLQAVYEAPTHASGQEAAAAFIQNFQDRYPTAVKCFEEDLEACLNHLRCPVRHRKYIRSTNMIERAFGEQRRRTKVIPRFFTEKSALKLVFACLSRAAQRWKRIRITELELAQLNRLRKEIRDEQSKSKEQKQKMAL